MSSWRGKLVFFFETCLSWIISKLDLKFLTHTICVFIFGSGNELVAAPGKHAEGLQRSRSKKPPPQRLKGRPNATC